MVLDEESDTRNIRQISAEIKSKRNALAEAFFSYKKHKATYDKHKDSDDPLERIQAEEAMHHSVIMNEAVIGCTKDIEFLKASYDKVMARVISKHGRFDESVFEIEEKRYWIKRGYKQSMRDVRSSGVISKGEQGLLELIGLEPEEVKRDILVISLCAEVPRKDTISQK